MTYGAREVLNEHGQGVALYMTGVDGVELKASHYDFHNPDGIYHQDGSGRWWKWSESQPGVFEFDAKPDGKWSVVDHIVGRKLLPWGQTIDNVTKAVGGITIEMGYGK